ncbi:hypothetical protein RAB80_005909 [Fusarium oxysporum f. sp. vasinfectum]|nr:hypothetical protein RAB80_005909 [Fusarium oxysporum f. sp. vasinfectum]
MASQNGIFYGRVDSAITSGFGDDESATAVQNPTSKSQGSSSSNTAQSQAYDTTPASSTQAPFRYQRPSFLDDFDFTAESHTKDRRSELLWKKMRTSSGVPLIAALGRSTTLGLLNPSSFALNAAIAHVFATESTGMKIYLARSMIGFKKIRISVATWSLKMKGGRRLKQLKQLKKRQIGTSLAVHI